MTAVATGVTRQLAGFAVDTRWNDIPPDVRDTVALHLVDALAAMYAGSTRAWTGAARAHALAESAPGRCGIVGSADRLRPAMAAFVNATATHGLELDDYHVPAAVHAGCVVVPAGIAVAEDLQATSRSLLTALAVGYEVVIRLGLAMSPEMTQDRGFHVTGVMGPLGAAATAANLHRLDAEQAVWALGLAAAQAGGTTEFTRSGGEVKRLHAGFAASAGLHATALAARGVSAPAHALEGPRGYAQAFGGRRIDLDQLTDGLGHRWHLDGLGIKAWSTCTGNHAPLAAVGKLCAEGLDAAEVERIDVYTDRTTAEHCGHVGPLVSDLTGAQFSLHVTLAMRIALGGNDPAHYALLEQAGFAVPEVTQVAKRVRVFVGDEQERAFSSAPSARVLALLRDGTTMSATASAPGAPHDPFGWSDVEQKAHRVADATMGTEVVDRMMSTARAWAVNDVPVAETLPWTDGERSADDR
ncbi:MmgE/PrpD family protein [Blastococcus sp. PRF04-17]|uniref:MmgE/PrpD family protein n=1 Tax=Blastococcus sp. PRF04-17 TaxID=2933797 RepID=UPI001FF355E7|nr:MmgE/PrpD family protein [Blastococcus sp. PRF04-17]UOY03198.1 MmgE/PrpD family protein [Blastococcus sp. PRF04-17]